MNKTYLATNIAYLRKLKGLTREDLAHLVGVEIAIIQQWEEGLEVMDTGRLLRLSKVLWVRTMDLLEKDLTLNEGIKFYFEYLKESTYKIKDRETRFKNYNFKKDLEGASAIEQEKLFKLMFEHSKECTNLVACFWQIIEGMTDFTDYIHK